MPENEVLATPFSVFSYEVENGGALLGGEYATLAVIVEEITVDKFVFRLLIQHMDSRFVVIIINDEKNKDVYKSIRNLTYVFLQRLHAEKIGTFNAKNEGRFKYKNSNGVKSTYKARNIIYVSGKEKATSTNGKIRHNVRHIEGWSVSSHWRRLNNPESLGLDRNGDRNTLGYTWVSDYIKGDEASIKTMIRRVK